MDNEDNAGNRSPLLASRGKAPKGFDMIEFEKNTAGANATGDGEKSDDDQSEHK